MITAHKLLKAAKDDIVKKGVQRDSPRGERSMGITVAAFNALTGQRLSEEEGWIFMVVLKLARSRRGSFNADDYGDCASYVALAGECRSCM